MAKGKYEPFDDLDEEKPASTLSCIVCFFAWLAPIALVLSIVLFFSPGERVKDIEEYNKQAKEWEEHHIAYFNETIFEISINNQEAEPMELVTTQEGFEFPVRDTCTEKDDPKDGCYHPPAAYFAFETGSFDKEIEYRISESGILVVNGTVHPSSKTQSMCHRVVSDLDHYVLDHASAYQLNNNPHHRLGCYYSSGWKPEVTGKQAAKTLRFELRLYLDPVVVASSVTKGCSDVGTNKQCFGVSKPHLNAIAIWGVIGAGSLTFVEIIVYILMFKFCKQKLPFVSDD